MIDETKQPAPSFDRDGFLVDSNQWSEQLARSIARKQGLGALTDAHWDVIRYLRRHYLSRGTIPAARVVCSDTGQPESCVQDLFGADMKVAWRIAGLPDPGEEAKSYM